jgi:hypothetical protein
MAEEIRRPTPPKSCMTAGNRRVVQRAYARAAKPAMMLTMGPARESRSRHGVTDENQPNYQQENHVDPPFRFQRRPGPCAGLSCLKLRCFAQEPVSSLSVGMLIEEWRAAANPRQEKPTLEPRLCVWFCLCPSVFIGGSRQFPRSRRCPEWLSLPRTHKCAPRAGS